jgi:hypothetical protein
MPGFSSLDDFTSEVTQNGKFWRQEWAKQTGGAVQAVGCAYDLNCYPGNPTAFLYGGTTKTFVACDSTPVAITTGTATAASADITGITNNAAIRVGMLVTGSAGTVTIPAGAYILSMTVAGTTTITLSAVTGGSSTGTPNVIASFPTIWHGGNVSSDLKSLINVGAGYYAAAFGANFLKFIDVLGYYPIKSTDVTDTNKRTLDNSITLPRYTTGEGVRAYFVVPIAPTAGGPNMTEFTYVNQAGTAGRLCPVAVSFNAAATSIGGQIPTANTGALKFIEIPLAAGDSGIRSVTSFTFSGGTAYTGSGALALVLCRPLTTLPITLNGVYAERNLMMQTPSLPQIVDGACIDLLNFSSAATTANTTIMGHAECAWG